MAAVVVTALAVLYLLASLNEPERTTRPAANPTQTGAGEPILKAVEEDVDPAGEREYERMVHQQRATEASERTGGKPDSGSNPEATPRSGGGRKTSDRKKRRRRQGGLSPAEWRQANRHALAISRACLRLSEGRIPSDRQIAASAKAVVELPDLLRKDPDTYRVVPGSRVRNTMRQLVGDARDAMLQGGCDPYGARAFSTALETLP